MTTTARLIVVLSLVRGRRAREHIQDQEIDLRNPVIVAALILVAAFVTGCGGDDTTSPAPTVTETFTGQLSAGGSVFHEFTLAATGDVTVTFVDLGGGLGVTIGSGIGAPADGTCPLQVINESVAQGAEVLAVADSPGRYCVALYDNGSFVEGQTINYEIRVTHP